MNRLFIVGTPRSGNTWLRYLLSELYDLKQFAVHTPDELDWDGLPDNCVVQLHWHNSPNFRSRLNRYNFRAVVIARHPLDLLISILHFAPNEAATARWLAGECGDERSIYHRSPVSSEFISYAVSSRAGILLSISRAWWGEPGAILVRYEDLVQDPVDSLVKITERIGPVSRPVSEVVESLTLENLKRSSQNQHYWKGQPGLWKALLPLEFAITIAKTHEGSFSTFGYHFDPDPLLTADEAERRWINLAHSGLLQ